MPWILLSWGVAFVLGFGALWLTGGGVRASAFPVGLVVCGVAMVGALVVSSVVGARMGRGLRQTGEVEWAGPVFGLAWPVGILGLVLLGVGLVVNGMNSSLLWLFLPTSLVLFIGIMYVIAGGIWPNWQTIAMGGWFVVVAVAAPFAGVGAHFLVLAVAGGGMFLLGALYTGLWIVRQGRTAAAVVAR